NNGSAPEHIATTEITSRAHLPGRLLLSERTVVDLRWVAGDPNHRYRNRLKLDWTVDARKSQIRPWRPTPAQGRRLNFGDLISSADVGKPNPRVDLKYGGM